MSRPLFKKLVGMLANAHTARDIGRVASWCNSAFELGQLTEKEHWALSVAVVNRWNTRRPSRQPPFKGSDLDLKRDRNARQYTRRLPKKKRGKKSKKGPRR